MFNLKTTAKTTAAGGLLGGLTGALTGAALGGRVVLFPAGVLLASGVGAPAGVALRTGGFVVGAVVGFALGLFGLAGGAED